MTDERVERVRAGIEAFSRGDFDAALDGFSPELEWVVGSDLVPDGRTYRGHDGVLEFWSMWHGLFRDFRLEIDELAFVDDSTLLMLVRAHGMGAESGAQVHSRLFNMTFRYRGEDVVHVSLHGGRRRG